MSARRFKPMTFGQHLESARLEIETVIDRINAMGAMSTEDVDMWACFAANSLEGTKALLRDMEREYVARPSKRRKRKVRP